MNPSPDNLLTQIEYFIQNQPHYDKSKPVSDYTNNELREIIELRKTPRNIALDIDKLKELKTEVQIKANQLNTYFTKLSDNLYKKHNKFGFIWHDFKLYKYTLKHITLVEDYNNLFKLENYETLIYKGFLTQIKRHRLARLGKILPIAKTGDFKAVEAFILANLHIISSSRNLSYTF